MFRILFRLFGLLLLVGSTATQAHLLKVHATLVDDHIAGSVQFSGGNPVPHARITIKNDEGEALKTLEADTSGSFKYRPEQAIDLLIIAETHEGHMAQTTLHASEIAVALEPTSDDKTGDVSSKVEVERAVARQIAPLKRQLSAMEEQRRFQDILGALGYILGLAGLGAWFMSRKQAQ